MAEEEIVIKYRVDTTEFKQVSTAVDNVTDKLDEMGQSAKAAFSEAQIEQATRELYEQGKVMEALIMKHGTAKKAMAEVNKELQTMAVLGKRGTKEFKELEQAAAELADTIGDTRDAVKKLASDTRTIDLVAQGVRGIAAGMSVATGAAALFGQENEDLQKSLLKVQGALATMQGAQELANLATEKGGIATVAYGYALKGVEAISKTFGISMAASWAVATAGLSVLVAGVIGLIAYLKSANDEQEILKQYEEDRKKQNEIYAETQKNANKEQAIADEQRRQAAKNDKELALINIDILKRQVESEKERQIQLGAALSTFNETERATVEYQKVYSSYLDSQQKELELNRALQVEISKITDLRKKEAEEQQRKALLLRAQSLRQELLSRGNGEEATPLITEADVAATTDNIDLVEQAVMDFFKNRAIEQAQASGENSGEAFMTSFANTLQAISPQIHAFSNLMTAIFEGETQALQNERDAQMALMDERRQRELLNAANDAEKRAQIDARYTNKKEQLARDFARKEAEIKRQAAIQQKAVAIFDIIANTAVAVSKYVGELPGSAPLLALAVATGAIQIATVAAQPLPEIPKFEKGGEVKKARALFGGSIRPDNMIIGRSHREGGVLIEAQGGEVINHVEASAKYRDELKAANEMRLENLIANKYVAPALENERRKAKHKMLVVNNDYDDALLRKTIRDTSAANAKYIADKVSNAITNSAYLKSEYR